MLFCVWKYLITFEFFSSHLCFLCFLFSSLANCSSVLVLNVTIKRDDLVLHDELLLKIFCESSRLPVGINKRQPRNNKWCTTLLRCALSQEHQRSWLRVRDVICHVTLLFPPIICLMCFFFLFFNPKHIITYITYNTGLPHHWHYNTLLTEQYLHYLHYLQ